MNLSNSISEFAQISKSRIVRDTTVVFIGNMVGAFLGIISMVLITRVLGPEQFGLFSVAFAFMMIASQFSDFGLNIGSVRFATLYLQNERLKADLIFKVSLKIKLIIGMLVFLIGFVFSESLAIHVFGKPELSFPLKLAFIGALGTSMAGFITIILQAKQFFYKYAFVNLIIPLGKLTIIGLLFLTLKLNLFSALSAFVILPFMAFLIGSLVIPNDFLKASGNEGEMVRKLFHFNKWILLSVFCVSIYTRLDVLMLTYFKSAEIVGQYSAGYNLGFGFSILLGSFTAVLLPVISKLTSKQEILNYTKKTLKITLLLAIIFTPILFLAKPLILLIYGVSYSNSAVVFQILFIRFLLTLIVNPVSMVMYSMNKPSIGAYGNLLQLIFNFTGNYLFIPSYGLFGAAMVSLATDIFGGLFILYFIYINYKSMDNQGISTNLKKKVLEKSI